MDTKDKVAQCTLSCCAAAWMLMCLNRSCGLPVIASESIDSFVIVPPTPEPQSVLDIIDVCAVDFQTCQGVNVAWQAGIPKLAT